MKYIYENVAMPIGTKHSELTRDLRRRHGRKTMYSVLWKSLAVDPEGEWFSVDLRIRNYAK